MKSEHRSSSFFLHSHDYILYYIAVIVIICTLFSPSLVETVIVLAVDAIATIIVIYINEWKKNDLYPNSQLFYPELKEEKIKSLSLNEQIRFLKALLDFPFKRSLIILILSNIKALPSLFLIVYWWEGGESSYLEKWGKILSIVPLLFFYYYAAVFVAVHSNISSVVDYLHHKYDFSQAFLKIEIKPNNTIQFIMQESIALASIVVLSVILEVAMLNSVAQEVGGGWKTLVIMVVCLVLILRTYFHFRTFFYNGLQQIISFLDSIGKNSYQQLPLSTSYVLANFQKTINKMIVWLENNNHEIENWIVHETEQARVRTIGELSALMAHDLLGPLHTIQFCVDELEESNLSKLGSYDENLPENQISVYVQQIKASNQKAIALIDSIKAHLKNPQHNRSSCHPYEAHCYALELVIVYYRQQGSKKIKVEFDEKLHSIILNISRMNLIHVFYNLYKNAFENILTNKIENPYLKIYFSDSYDNKFTVMVQDNGSGLTKEVFDAMTSTKSQP